MKKLPPYSKALHQLQKESKRPSHPVYLWIGEDAWNKGASLSIDFPFTTLALPENEQPMGYHWPVKDCVVAIVDTSSRENEDYIDKIVYSLYRDGAALVAHVAKYREVHFYSREQ